MLPAKPQIAVKMCRPVLPTIGAIPGREFVDDGGLMSYGANHSDMFKMALIRPRKSSAG
jgi:hypothetical protein